MAQEQIKPGTLPTPQTIKLSAQDATNIVDALEMAAKSYKRAQNQRPQFATIAHQIEIELNELIGRIKSQMPSVG